MKKWVAVLLVLLLAAGIAGCGGKEKSEENGLKGQETRIFTDSAGRRVEVSTEIRRIIPSGDMAQMFLWPLGSDKLAAVSRKLSDSAVKYLGNGTSELPEVGNLYKTGDQLNLEEIASLHADIIIDFGEAKDGIAEELDNLQELLGIPCVFISGTLENSADSYRMLGELLGMRTEAEALAAYIEKVVGTTREVFERVPKKDAVVLNGNDGLGCVASGTYFDEIWAYMLNNIAVVEESQMYASTNIDFEQLAVWDPQYLFFYNHAMPEDIASDGVWGSLNAVKNGNYYSVPEGPYDFVSPPSVNRYLAIVWLGDILYPGEFGWDAGEMVREFYRLFYHYELDDAGYQQLVGR